MKKIVEIIAIDNRYKDSNYMFRPAADGQLGVVLTGQHKTPQNDDGLTTDQMIGKEKLTDIQRAKYPYVINPDNPYPLWNRKKYDISTNKDGKPVVAKDYFEFIMIRDFSYGVVAKSKSTVKTGTSRFYIHDVEAEAKQIVSKEDLIYDALKYVREECTIESYNDLATLLNYKISGFNIDTKNMTDVVVRQRLYEACKTHPAEVLSCKEDSANDDLFVLKAATYQILRRSGEDFYDGSKFIGKGLNGVKRFMSSPDNNFYVSKWKTLVEEKEGRITPKQKTAEEEKGILEEEYKKLDRSALIQMCIHSKYKKSDYEELSDDELRKYVFEKRNKK